MNYSKKKGEKMSVISDIIKDSRKIVIKLGSNVLSDDKGNANRELIASIAAQVDEMHKQGKQVVIVSSGAGICGVGAINKWSRRGDINYKQALCAIGQVELMMAYKEHFSKYAKCVITECSVISRVIECSNTKSKDRVALGKYEVPESKVCILVLWIKP